MMEKPSYYAVAAAFDIKRPRFYPDKVTGSVLVGGKLTYIKAEWGHGEKRFDVTQKAWNPSAWVKYEALFLTINNPESKSLADKEMYAQLIFASESLLHHHHYGLHQVHKFRDVAERLVYASVFLGMRSSEFESLLGVSPSQHEVLEASFSYRKRLEKWAIQETAP